jgi:flavin reductase (DIM6/NTAB) family NADH-FMN oxidoreductase RutF
MSAGIDPAAFRETMGLFATGVTVIATEHEDEIHAMTANAVTSVSLDPLLILVCVGKRARMAEFLTQEAGFSINILREEQKALSNYFAGSWEEANPPPFRFVHWDGRPRLQGCLASIGCTCFKTLEGGDHWIVVGKVVSLHIGVEPRWPLLFYNGRYGRLGPAERTPAPDLGWVEAPVQVFYDPWRRESG